MTFGLWRPRPTSSTPHTPCGARLCGPSRPVLSACPCVGMSCGRHVVRYSLPRVRRSPSTLLDGAVLVSTAPQFTHSPLTYQFLLHRIRKCLPCPRPLSASAAALLISHETRRALTRSLQGCRLFPGEPTLPLSFPSTCHLRRRCDIYRPTRPPSSLSRTLQSTPCIWSSPLPAA